MIEVYLPAQQVGEVQRLLAEHGVSEWWWHGADARRRLLRVLAPAERAEPLLDALQEALGGHEGFRIVLLSVEATLPRLDLEEGEVAEPSRTGASTPQTGAARPEASSTPLRVSREELYQDALAMSRRSPVYLVMVALSTLVAAIGLIQDSAAVVIGAMVIAPLLGPNMALCLGTTLGDLGLVRSALEANLAGVLLALVLSLGLGAVLPVGPGGPEIAARTSIDLADIGLALASGSAGALAFTSGVSASLVGVMVAVALLPPLVAAGLLLGAGRWEPALGALLLLAANVICLNLAGVLTFVVQGIRPRTWWEEERARRASRIALALWALLLLALLAVILIERGP